ncbi:hypothetical protein EFS38_15765 [Dickeya undicola]|uniref:Uncharacterized protein n=1 Tax=Dickeya undicola TaxID=1577887 RepID=A0ABX9WTK6_9GAMM|nr:hypothetical protein EFS38_15765 [Dickeya undicola]
MLLSVIVDTLAEAGLPRPDNQKFMPKQAHVTTIGVVITGQTTAISVAMTAITPSQTNRPLNRGLGYHSMVIAQPP